jgi:hypothetical protein
MFFIASVVVTWKAVFYFIIFGIDVIKVPFTFIGLSFMAIKTICTDVVAFLSSLTWFWVGGITWSLALMAVSAAIWSGVVGIR